MRVKERPRCHLMAMIQQEEEGESDASEDDLPGIIAHVRFVAPRARRSAQQQRDLTMSGFAYENELFEVCKVCFSWVKWNLLTNFTGGSHEMDVTKGGAVHPAALQRVMEWVPDQYQEISVPSKFRSVESATGREYHRKLVLKIFHN